jgi:hypothetical protein
LNFPGSFERNGTKDLCVTMVTGRFRQLEIKGGENFPLSKVKSVELNPKRAGSEMLTDLNC